MSTAKKFYISATSPQKSAMPIFRRYDCIYRQTIAKQNHVFQKISLKNFRISATNHEKMSVVAIFSPYLCNQFAKTNKAAC